MKYHLYMLIMLGIYHTLSACPTCIGKGDKESPPFFTKEYESHYRHRTADGLKKIETPKKAPGETNTSTKERNTP